MIQKELLTRAETSELVGLSIPTIQRLRTEGDFPMPVILGRATIRFKRAEIEAWLRARPRQNEGRKQERKTATA